MIRLAAAGAVIIAVLSLVMWKMGDDLSKKTTELDATKSQLVACNAKYEHAAAVTRQWSDKYNTDIQALKDESAQLYADQQVRSQASCKAQFNAGYRYGLGVGSATPGRLRAQDDDFRNTWLGNAGAN